MAAPGEETRDLLARRLRAGLGICLTSITLFALADLFLSPARVPLLYPIKVFGVAVIAAVFFALRRPRSRRWTVGLGIVTVGVMALTTAASGIATEDAATTPILMVIVMMATATLIPWGVWPQLATQVLASSAVLWNIEAVQGFTAAAEYLTVALVVGFIASLYSAYTFEHDRLERERAEVMLLEAQAQQHHAELAHAARLSTLGEMAAGLAHELNQPLAAIVSYARGCSLRLRSGEAETGALVEVVEEISAQALRAGEVLRRIRDFVRSGELRRERVDLNDVVREAVRFAEIEARQSGISMPLELTSDTLTVEVDRIQVEQVVLNLVRNGFEAMRTTAPTERTLSIRTARHAGEGIEVAVGDTGTGIPPGIAGRVFDPFFSTKRDGLGLGLSISRSIIEAHGGRLWAIANPLRGATFRFTLPEAGDVGSHAA
jgi:C4-dicarboxylate-specific signal transduction histidine kinase